ncbi:benzoate 1,2-dioxygenase small subunit [Pigmentiphaga soli]|uniref:Benzoate 1,2-dioxygenase small subunit n=1 Tax=Pigmentiphaga soli TaxID=1007095 RepID=A0ABP8HPM6_9BURK
MNALSRERLEAGIEVVQLDGVLLDERRWDEWLDLYTPDCRFWLPMWRDETTLNDDTDNSLAHIFYQSRRGLEDRITRVRAGKSPVTTPLPRTSHLVSHIMPGAAQQPDALALRATWACHVLFPRSRMQHTYFGRAEYLLAPAGGAWKIKSKKVLLLNDDIPGVLDVYCV